MSDGRFVSQVQQVSTLAVFHLTLTDTLQSQARQVLQELYTQRQHASSKIIPSPHPLWAPFHDSALPPLRNFSLWQNADQRPSHSGCLYPQTLPAVSCSLSVKPVHTDSFTWQLLHVALSRLSPLSYPNTLRPTYYCPLWPDRICKQARRSIIVSIEWLCVLQTATDWALEFRHGSRGGVSWGHVCYSCKRRVQGWSQERA